MLLGENGAGKSSLMKVLCGAYRADAGEFHYKGEKVAITSTADAQKLGIAVIFQEFSLVPISISRRTSSSAANQRAAFPARSTAAKSWPTPSACSI